MRHEKFKTGDRRHVINLIVQTDFMRHLNVKFVLTSEMSYKKNQLILEAHKSSIGSMLVNIHPAITKYARKF